MTDQRPQYGELATVEEQRRAAGLPPEPTPVPEAADPSPAARTDAEPSPRARPWDRVVTIGLLAYGLVNVVMAGLSYLDYATVMNDAMRVLGVDGEFTNFAQGKLWGTIAAIVLAAGWVVTAMLSVRRLRTGRLTWWVPIVGAAVTLFLTSICAAIPMAGDPAFVDFLMRTSGS